MADMDKFNLKIEQLILGELSPLEEKELLKDPAVAARAQELKESNKEFFSKFNIKELAAETEKRAEEDIEKKIITFPLNKVAGFAAAAACFLVLYTAIPTFRDANPFSEPEIIKLKGSTELSIYKKQQDETVSLKNKSHVQENDLLQITYKSMKRYGAIFSVDGWDKVTFHYPESLYDSTELDMGKIISLKSSYQLDNAPDFEKFYFITSDEPFDLDYIKEQADEIKVNQGKISQELILSDDFTITSVLLLKD